MRGHALTAHQSSYRYETDDLAPLPPGQLEERMATHRYYQANAARRRELRASAGTRVVGAEAPGGLGQEPDLLGLLPDLSAAQLDDLGSPPDVDLLLPGAEPSPVAGGMFHAATGQPRDAVELGNDLFDRFRGLSPALIRRQLLGDVPDPDDVTLFWLTVIAQFQRRLATTITELAEDQRAADRSGNAAWVSCMDFLRRLRRRPVVDGED